MSGGPILEGGYVLLWLVLFVGLGAIALPSVAVVFARLGDRGAGLAIPSALCVIGVVGYWGGRLTFGPLIGLLAVGALAGASGWALRRGVAVDWRRYGEISAVFALAFGFLVFIRTFDPSIVALGGEKFLDYGLLNTLYRAETLPPEDPWFAGERVRYYYGGHLIAALLGHLAVTPPHYAYNLALAGFYATIVSTVYGLAGAIAADAGYSRLRAALAGAVLVGLASNLATPVRLVVWLVPGGRTVAETVGIPTTRNGGETVAFGPSFFGYWDASRVIPGTINEFPFFAFLNGDLHAHMLSVPFLCLAVGCCYAYWRTPLRERGRRQLLVFGAMPIIAGWLAVTNTWDFPTSLGLLWLTLALAPAPPWTLLPGRLEAAVSGRFTDLEERTIPTELLRPIVAVALVIPVALLGAAFVFPFFAGAASTGGRTIALVTERSDLPSLLLVHGTFLLVAAWLLSRRLLTDGDGRLMPPTTGRLEIAAAGGLLALLAILAWALAMPAMAVIAPVVLVGWYAIRTDRGGFETLLFVAGAGLVVTVELLYLSEQAGPGRLNTVFKTYIHVWVFWSIAAGVGLSMLSSRYSEASSVEDGGPSGSRLESEAESERGTITTTVTTASEPITPPNTGETATATTTAHRRRATVFAVILLIGLSLYAGLALADHVGDREELTLDARSDVQTNAPQEAAAFAWLTERSGQPRILEAPTPSQHTYGSTDGSGEWPPSRYVNGASTFSGLPTIAGWTHSADYHGQEPYDQRVADAEVAFTGDTSERAAVLLEYEIEYIYVGPNERAWYDLAALEDDAGIEVEEEFGEEVTIYRVELAALDG